MKKGTSKVQRALFWHFPAYLEGYQGLGRDFRATPYSIIRSGDWKLIYYYLPETPKQPKALLYNLKDDPEERNELSSAHPDKCREMIQEMSAQLEKEGALYPVDKQGNELKPFVYF